jgi:biotin operon repressor
MRELQVGWVTCQFEATPPGRQGHSRFFGSTGREDRQRWPLPLVRTTTAINGYAVRVGEVTERIEQTIRSMIERGDLKPGGKLPSERELAEQLAVGRTSVRVVLAKLTTLGLIEAQHGRGYFVSSSAGSTSAK